MKMKVYLLMQDLLMQDSDERIISSDLISFVENKIINEEVFRVKSVPKGKDPYRIPHALIGYNPNYGLAYISNPESSIGLLGIRTSDKSIICSLDETPFFLQRDSIAYATPEQYYIRESYIGLLQEFRRNGYRFSSFVPQKPEDRLIRHRNPEDIVIGHELELTDLL